MSLAFLSVVLVCQTLAILTQSVYAGEFLAGSDGAVKFHEVTGWTVLSVFVFLAAGPQVDTGYGRFLNLHVPLGVILFGATAAQAISVFLKRNEV